MSLLGLLIDQKVCGVGGCGREFGWPQGSHTRKTAPIIHEDPPKHTQISLPPQCPIHSASHIFTAPPWEQDRLGQNCKQLVSRSSWSLRWGSHNPSYTPSMKEEQRPARTAGVNFCKWPQVNSWRQSWFGFVLTTLHTFSLGLVFFLSLPLPLRSMRFRNDNIDVWLFFNSRHETQSWNIAVGNSLGCSFHYKL